MKRLIKWIAAVSGSFMILAVVAGFLYQQISESSDLKKWPPPGTLVDVAGDLMHIYCQGQGSPTVIVEQGIGAYYDTWNQVNRELSSSTRVCAYDRAGTGYSEPLGRLVKVDEISERLHLLLQAANIDDDLILVGWSAGGIFIRDYFRKYPENVKAMVLVDSSHEQQRSRLIDPSPPQTGIDIRRIASLLVPFGVVRISGVIDSTVDRGPGSEQQKQRLKVIQNQSHWAREYFNEVDAFEQALAMNRKPPSLGDLPLVVLTRGKEVVQGGMPSYYTLDILRENESSWQAMQRELTELSSQGSQVMATESGHSIHLDQPDLLIKTIRTMVTKISSM